jgi:hypothetical protein
METHSLLRKRIPRKRRRILIHAEVQTVGCADPVLATAVPLIATRTSLPAMTTARFGRRLDLRCGLWTTSWWWEPELGGLTASLVLSRVAARVTLVERAERPSEVGAALALQPNGMAVLERLGLLPAVKAVSARIDRMDIRSVTGRTLLTPGMPDLGAGLDHAIAIRRTEPHRLSLEAVAGVASIDRRFGCAAVSGDPSGAVTITSTTQNGPDLGSMSLRVDVKVGADGVNSTVRSTGGFKSRDVRTIVRGRASPWFVGVLDLAGILRPGTARWRPGLLLGCSPCGRGG